MHVRSLRVQVRAWVGMGRGRSWGSFSPCCQLSRVAHVHGSTGTGVHGPLLNLKDSHDCPLQNTSQLNGIGKENSMVTSECCLLPGGDSCPFCLQLLLPGLLLVLIIIILILAFWILPKLSLIHI